MRDDNKKRDETCSDQQLQRKGLIDTGGLFRGDGRRKANRLKGLDLNAPQQGIQQAYKYECFRHESLSLSVSGQRTASAAEPVSVLFPSLSRSLAQQPDRFPDNGQHCKAQAKEKRHNRAMETFQATINDPGKDGEPEHKE